MLSVSFQTAFIAIAQIFSVGAIGYYLTKKKVIDDKGLKLLSFLSVNVTFPLFIFYQITHFFNPHETANWWGYPLINIVLMLGGIALSSFLFVLMGKKPKDEFLAAAHFHNAGYIPILMAMALPLGEMAGKVYAAMIISVIGFDLCLWSVGVWLLTKADKPHFDLKQMFNPPLLSMASAIAFVLLLGNNFIPEVFFKPIKVVGDGAMALAMMVIGGNLALTDFRSIKVKRVGLAVLMKMCLIPTVAIIALMYLNLDPLMKLIIIIQSAMPTAITLSIISRHHGSRHQDFINQSIFVSHVVAVITIPIVLGVYAMVVK